MNTLKQRPQIELLKYGNTNTYFISPGFENGKKGILLDTDWANTLPGFFKAIKRTGIKTGDIAYLLITHYHPDHMGIAGELQELGIKPLIMDVQREFVHGSDGILIKSGKKFTPIDESAAVIVSCSESRDLLRGIGIDGEMIRTPGHSNDSISLILDSKAAFVGDLPPLDVTGGCGDTVKASWSLILSYRPNVLYYGHANERRL